MPDAPQPYAHLTPDAVMDALLSVDLPPDGRLLTLNSFENRVFQAGLDDGRTVVAKFYRPGRWTPEQILEEHRFAADLVAAEVPVVPPLTLQNAQWLPDVVAPSVLHGQPSTLAIRTVGDAPQAFAVSLRRGGRAPELEDPEVLRWIGRLMARLHQCGRQQRFEHRRTLSVHTWGREARQWLHDHGDLPSPQRERWLAAADEALDLAQALFDRIPDLQTGRIHGDCHLGNILWTPDDGPHFVDLDDACNGPAVQDLWMMLGGHRRDSQSALFALMDGYESLAEFDWREWSLVEALRTLRLIHHSAWLARRWDDPAFPAAFPWFAQASYWQQQADQLAQQNELMREELDGPPMG